MLYNEFERRVDQLQSDIHLLKQKQAFKDAAIKGLELVYLKVNYYEQCLESEKIHPVSKTVYDSYQTALYELANKRDYLFEHYGYEEA